MDVANCHSFGEQNDRQNDRQNESKKTQKSRFVEGLFCLYNRRARVGIYRSHGDKGVRRHLAVHSEALSEALVLRPRT